MGLLYTWLAGVVFIMLALGISFSISYVLANFTNYFGPLLGMIFTVLLYGTAVPVVVGFLLLRGVSEENA